jgi:hypothetical protein|tara:strand:+ start:659 stop:1012 length:354 start_codon:yes stop_codon:yes gene_type:complete
MAIHKTDIIETISRLDIDLGDIAITHYLYDLLDYDGSIHQLIDDSIDWCYHDLRQWSVDHYHYIEQAIDEGLIDISVPADFHKMIQAGQYVWLSAIAWDLVAEVFADHVAASQEVTE